MAPAGTKVRCDAPRQQLWSRHEHTPPLCPRRGRRPGGRLRQPARREGNRRHVQPAARHRTSRAGRPAHRRAGPCRPAVDAAAGLRRRRASDPGRTAQARAVEQLARDRGSFARRRLRQPVRQRRRRAGPRVQCVRQTRRARRQPHRVLVQLPDAFDAGKRCVVVAASSGSRGIYGAIAVAGAWGLPRGCAVAYTDKGAGTDYFDLDAGQGVAADGTLAPADAALAFVPQPATGSGVAFKHAHSQDNPEADWGRHVKQAAQFALATLDAQLPQAGAVHLRQHPCHRGGHLQRRRRGAARGGRRRAVAGRGGGGRTQRAGRSRRRPQPVRLHHRGRAADAVRAAAARHPGDAGAGREVRGPGRARPPVRRDRGRVAEGRAGEAARRRLDRCGAAGRRDQRGLRPVACGGGGLCLRLRPLRA